MSTLHRFAGSSQPFPPKKKQQGVVLEAPISADASDRLEFGDYADVLVERMTDPAAWPVGVGIYAQWGAGKVSPHERSAQDTPHTANPVGVSCGIGDCGGA